MNEIGNKLKSSLAKRQEALKAFKARKEAFLLEKQQIIRDIEEAREIWRTTLKQLPNQPFSQ
jgi:Tfp pilus assembly protein PilN